MFWPAGQNVQMLTDQFSYCQTEWIISEFSLPFAQWEINRSPSITELLIFTKRKERKKKEREKRKKGKNLVPLIP